jgi:hypothetical protein
MVSSTLVQCTLVQCTKDQLRQFVVAAQTQCMKLFRDPERNVRRVLKHSRRITSSARVIRSISSNLSDVILLRSNAREEDKENANSGQQK